MFASRWWVEKVEGWVEDEVLVGIVEGALLEKISWNYLFRSFEY